nr:substrate-binding domain-containing protein [uncultured Neokomagataea sp.]
MKPLLALTAGVALVSHANAQSLCQIPNGFGAAALTIGVPNAVAMLEKPLTQHFLNSAPNFQVQEIRSNSSVNPARLAFDQIDIAFMGRRISDIETTAFKKATGNKPLELAIAYTPSMNARNAAWSLAVYVNKNNPLTAITMNELGRIVTQPLNESSIRTWNQIIKDKKYDQQPIHVYATPRYSGFGDSVRNLFNRQDQARGTVIIEDSDMILDRISHDPYGIGIAALGQHNAEIHEVSILNNNGKLTTGTEKEINNGDYPLKRMVYVYVNSKISKEKNNSVCSYLKYMLSKKGQYAISTSKNYFLPLNKQDLTLQKAKLAP